MMWQEQRRSNFQPKFCLSTDALRDAGQGARAVSVIECEPHLPSGICASIEPSEYKE